MPVERLHDESGEYLEARAKLLAAEIALKEQVARVAELRRGLPSGPEVGARWVFQKGPEELAADAPLREVQLADLFGDRDELILIHFMYGGAQEKPCPMCSMWADGYDAVQRHVRQRAAFAVVAEAGIGRFRAWARERGWSRLRLLSSAGSSFKSDLRMQDEKGAQQPGVSVFAKAASGAIHHVYTGEAHLDGSHWNGVDLLSPVWHLFDLLPSGRGSWFPSL
jgi:predicted dithiol-disulfide oxidoreductase (DUF899 family)